MILQIMPQGDLSDGFIAFMEERFEGEFAYILVGDNTVAEIHRKSSDKTIFISERSQLVFNKRCRKLLADADAIIINWVDGVILSLLRPYRKKIGLLFWGGDLVFFLKGLDASSLISKVRHLFIKKQIEKAPCIITLTNGEIEQLRLRCQCEGKWFLGSFMSNTMKEIKELQPTRDKYGSIRILLGNSATKTNRHVEAMQMLSKFKDENIEVFAPLSYGDMSYAKEVKAEGERLFGKKFKPLLSMMDSSQYLSFLSSISVGVFNHNRQQGIGNVSRLLAFGSKVYLSEDGPMLLENLNEGFSVFRTEGIRDLTFEEFYQMRQEDRLKNMAKASFDSYADEAVKLWTPIIRYLYSIGK